MSKFAGGRAARQILETARSMPAEVYDQNVRMEMTPSGRLIITGPPVALRVIGRLFDVAAEDGVFESSKLMIVRTP